MNKISLLLGRRIASTNIITNFKIVAFSDVYFSKICLINPK